MTLIRHIFTFIPVFAAVAAAGSGLFAQQGRPEIDERTVVRRQGPMLPTPRDAMPPPRESSLGTAIVEGVVVSADLGRPVRRASVRLSPVVPGPPRSATSDDAGRFRFEGVAAGQFLLTASKPGYLESTFGQRQAGSGRPGTPLSVTAGQRLERVALPIARGGVLAGTVADDGGEPAFGTLVQAFRFAWQQGERTLQLAGTATADDRGSFRVGALPPGEYLVMAAPAGKTGVFDDMGILPKLGNAAAMSVGRMVMPSLDPATDGMTNDYAPVFYPGTTSSSSALRLTIGVSEERSGLDIRLPLVAMRRVEGVVMDNNGPAPNTEVRLIDLDMPISGLGLKSTATGPDGRFSFENVAPGRYRLQARTGPVTQMFVDDRGGERRVTMSFQAARLEGPAGGAMAFPHMAPQVETRWAVAEITLAGARPDPLTLSLQPGVSVSGRVTFDGPEQPPSDLSTFRVVLNGARPSEDGMSSSIAQITADGRFALDGVTPGTYRVSVLSPSSWRTKSFNVGGRDALDFLLTVSGSQEVSGAELTMTMRTSSLGGTLMDAAGRPVAANTIIVFPDDPTYWVPSSRRIRATRPSTDGHFSIPNLPAGTYRLVAVDDLEDGQWFDPEILQQLSSAALLFSIGDGESRTQDLRVRQN